MLTLRFPDGLNAQAFLNNYWQRQPLLMPGALPNVPNPLSPDELAGLACEPDVESRLIVEHSDPPWQVNHGPLDESTFAKLPPTHWTLLVQDVDKLVPEAASLLDPFAFLPRWRMDDLMISYAPTHGSVGPHLDAYDVFLVQTLGTRRWRISTRPYTDADLIPDLDIKVLADFHAEAEWLLEPGDVLYLPPGVAHWGIAESDDCMTCSVGFRSPSQAELAASWFEHLLAGASDRCRYLDPATLVPELGGEIPADATRQVRSLLEALRDWPDDALADWFGAYITEPKPHLPPEPADKPLDTAALASRLSAGGRLVANPVSRLAYRRSGPTSAMLFADGQAYPIGSPGPGILALCNRQPAAAESLGHDLYPVLTDLYNAGSLIWASADHEDLQD